MEKEAEEAAAKLSACILARYHEEQIWSDKIRRMSTWGTWGLMGVNVLLFLIFQIGVEPWRRKRLVKGFEDKVMEALEREGSVPDGSSADIETAQVVPPLADVKEDISVPVVEEVVLEPAPLVDGLTPRDDAFGVQEGVSVGVHSPLQMSTLGMLKETVRDLFSDRQIVLRRVDLTTATIEGAAAGVAFVGVLVLVLRPP